MLGFHARARTATEGRCCKSAVPAPARDGCGTVISGANRALWPCGCSTAGQAIPARTFDQHGGAPVEVHGERTLAPDDPARDAAGHFGGAHHLLLLAWRLALSRSVGGQG